MTILAHQGWDELLVAAAVALVVIGILRWSEHRARERAEEDSSSSEGEPPSPEREPPSPTLPPEAGGGREPEGGRPGGEGQEGDDPRLPPTER